MIQIFLCLLAALLFSSCAPQKFQLLAEPKASWSEQKALMMAGLTGDSKWEKMWWIEKTARTLRGGVGLGADESAEAFLEMTEDEILNHFMKDSRFGDTVLDFNLFFLGFKPDVVKHLTGYDEFAFDSPNAVLAAQQVMLEGDYFQLFNYQGTYFIPPLKPNPNGPNSDPSSKPRNEVRAEIYQEGLTIIQGINDWALAHPGASGQEACAELNKSVNPIFGLYARLSVAFNEANVLLIRAQPFPTGFDPLAQAFFAECTNPKEGGPDAARLLTEMQRAFKRYTMGFAEIFRHEESIYNPQTVLEIKPANLSAFRIVGPWVGFGLEHSVALGNSSTNMNRKRGAYMLKHFFCDDLKPVGFENPGEPIPGKHGSDTSCYSCHYKLDPMSGFFKNYGVFFNDFSQNEFVVFDDNAVINRDKYFENWKAPQSSGRTWNVGYVRSPKWEQQNVYGESLEDLSRILRTAPEVKRCLMKRMFEYLVSETQTVDSGYLDYLTKEFSRESDLTTGGNSAKAFKSSMKRILAGETFRNINPEPDQCYDFPPGHQPANAPPCRVNFLLQKNCAQCHGTGEGSDGGLDLTKWVQTKVDGKFHFPHYDEMGEPVPAEETFVRVLDRLSTQDPKKRMPKNKFMDSQERQEIYLWVNEQMLQMKKGGN